MLCHYQRGLGKTGSRQYVLVRALPWAQGELSMLEGANPAVVNGDIICTFRRTMPDSFILEMTSTGVPIIYSNGDVSGQHFDFDVYDWSTRAFMGEVTDYVNNHAPVFLDQQPHVILLARNLEIDPPIDLTSFVVDYEADPLTFSSTDAPPPGLTLANNQITGTPDTPGSYVMHFTVRDPAGGSTVAPLFTFVVGNEIAATIDQIVTVFKTKAGTPGPPGTGSDGLSVNISRDSFIVFCYADGTPVSGSFAGADGYLTVLLGSTDDTANAALSATGTGCTGTINTADNDPVLGQPRGYYRVTAMSAETGTLRLQVVDAGATIVRSFMVSKVRAGYEIVGTLPTTNLFEGRIVFLAKPGDPGDGKLFRYHAGAWTAMVAASDIFGGLSSDQIASLDAAKLTGLITNTKIADNAIETRNIKAGNVVTASMTANTILGDRIQANTMDASKISAQTITAAQIAGLTITGDKIAGGQITAAKLASTELITVSAQIRDLTVTTLHIQANAITQAAAAYSNPTRGTVGVSWNARDVWTTKFSLAYTATGFRVDILAMMAMDSAFMGVGNTLQVRLLRDATLIGSADAYYPLQYPSAFNGWLNGGTDGSMTFGTYARIFTDTPPAGAHTYSLQTMTQGFASSDGLDITSMGLKVMESKR